MKKQSLIILSLLSACIMNAQQKGTFTDKRDDKTYKTVTIGEQTWLAENLAFKTSEGCYMYKNDTSSIAKYGYFYNWETAKKVCPTGWRLPGKKDYEKLIKSHGNLYSAYKALEEGGKSGFNAQYAGYLYYKKHEKRMGIDAIFVTSTEEVQEYIFVFIINNSYGEAMVGSLSLDNAYNVRCIKKK